MLLGRGMSAFLEKTNWMKACGGQNRPLLPGALLEVVVTAAPKLGKRMVHVSVDPKAKAKAVAKVGDCAAHICQSLAPRHSSAFLQPLATEVIESGRVESCRRWYLIQISSKAVGSSPMQRERA